MTEEQRGSFVLTPKPAGKQPVGKSIFIGIAINTYDNKQAFKTLNNPVRDVTAVAELLEKEYKFDVIDLRLVNEIATQANIVARLGELKQGNQIGENDSLVIYYAGHGIQDLLTKASAIIPVDANLNNFLSFLPAVNLLTQFLPAIPCRHLVLILDCCFSGGFAQEALVEATEFSLGADPPANLLEDLFFRKSRHVLTSGWLQTVSDGKGGEHSPFAKALLECLRNANDLNLLALANRLRPLVLQNGGGSVVEQSFDAANHQKGEFVFFRKKTGRPVPQTLREALLKFNFTEQIVETLTKFRQLNLFNLIYLHGSANCGHHLFANHFLKERGKQLEVFNAVPFPFRLGIGESAEVLDLWKVLSRQFCNSPIRLPEEQVIRAVLKELEAKSCCVFLKTDKRATEAPIETALLEFWTKLNQELLRLQVSMPQHPNRFFLFVFDRRGEEAVFDRAKFNALATPQLAKAICFSSIKQVDREEDLSPWIEDHTAAVNAELFVKLKTALPNLPAFEQKLYVEQAIFEVCELCERPECYEQIFLKQWIE